MVPNNLETHPLEIPLPVLNGSENQVYEPPAGPHPLSHHGNKLLKRSFDIVFSCLIIVLLLSWLLPLLALFILFTSRGSVFFIQQRTGLNNKTFHCIKLRTMYTAKGKKPLQNKKGDPRITFAGKFLRKFSLDELPQFFNVLAGHMSVIGPRPHMLKHTEEYAQVVGSFMLRHEIKPGITGLSQVLGYRGEIKDIKAINNRVRLDLFYMKKWNFMLDLRIILHTAKLMLFGDKNAF